MRNKEVYCASHGSFMTNFSTNQCDTLQATDYKDPPLAVWVNERINVMEDVCKSDYVVRRLVPRECAALQGFPKDWCDDVKHSDSAEYKLWGNGIALPSILGIMQNAVRVLEEEDEN